MTVVKTLTAINILWFVAMVCGSSMKTILLPSSDVLLDWGASSASSTLVDTQYWRLLTCCFVHVGVFHLAVNMFVLRDIGREVEQVFGKVNFLAIYLTAAVGGALTSMFANYLLVTAGASGAIFGVFGSMLAAVWRRPQLFPKGYLILHGKIILCLIVYSIVFSFIDKNTDNAAHFGGFAFGFVSGLCMLPSSEKTEKIAVLGNNPLFYIFVVLLSISVYCANLMYGRKSDVVAENRYYAAVKLLKTKQFTQAIPVLQRTIELNPRNVSAYCDLARAYLETGALNDALKTASEAIKIDRSSKIAHTVRASIFQKQGDYDNAIQDLTRVIEIDPKDPMAYNNRAWGEEAAGDYKACLADCETALRLDKNSATTYDTRAVAQILLGQFSEAEKHLTTAIELKPADGAFYYHRAIARIKAGRSHDDVLVKSDITAYKKYGYKPESWEPTLPL